MPLRISPGPFNTRISLQKKLLLDGVMLDLGRMLAESVMYIEREELSGPDYLPSSPYVHKWATQQGSVYVGDQKIKVQRPRLRNSSTGSEIGLKSYEKMRQSGSFSDELLQKSLLGLSGRRYYLFVQLMHREGT